METSSTRPFSSTVRRWVGCSALVAAGVFLAGRLAVEPLRTLPHFDPKGMDPFGAVETFQLREQPHDFSVAMLGSSVSIWGVLPHLVADELGLTHGEVRKLAVVGGTAFDHWKLIERDPEAFAELRVALVEINPRMMHPDMETDERLSFTISQHATWRERRKLHSQDAREQQKLDMVLPLYSVRRSLKSVLLNWVEPMPGTPMYPNPEARLHPFGGWDVPEGSTPHFRDVIPAHTAARRLVGNWRVSSLQDRCLRKTLKFFRERDIRVILYQLPVHPEVAAHIRENPQYAQGYAKYRKYVDSLGVPKRDQIQLLDIAECGVSREGMRDLTHFNETGATIYSKWLGGRLRAMLEAEEGGAGE